MKGRRIHLVLLPLFSIAGCRQEIEVSPVGQGAGSEILLINSSFELGGDKSLTGWTPSDTTLIDFSDQTPPGGGLWSVSIDGSTGPAASIFSLVAAKPGEHVYRLTVWGKASSVTGEATILLRTSESLEEMASTVIADTMWSMVSFLDTLTTNEGDSVGVKLSGGISEIGPGTVYFDLCVLDQL